MSSKFCDLCLSVSAEKKVTAVIFCVDCAEPLCESCQQYHQKSKLSRNHKLTDIQNAPSTEVAEMLHKLIACKTHSSEAAAYMCQDHDTLCCNDCFYLHHRKCETVQSLTNLGKSEDTSDQYKDKLSDIESTLDQFENHAGVLMDHENTEGNLIDVSETELTQSLKQIKDTLDNVYMRIERKAKTNYEKEKSSINRVICDQKQAIEKFINQVFDIKQNIDVVRNYGEKVHAYLFEKDLSNCQLDVLNQQLKTLHDSSTRHTLKISDISELGEKVKGLEYILKVNTDEQDVGLEKCPDWKTNDKVTAGDELERQSDAIGPRPFREREPKLTQTISMKTIPNKVPMADACLWVGNYIVASLRGYKTLEIVDTASFKIVDSYTCSSTPWSISQYENNTMLVCLPEETSVLLIAIKDGKFSGAHKETVKHRLYCMRASQKDRLLFGLCKDDGSLHMYDKTFKYVETIQIVTTLSAMVQTAYRILVDESQAITHVYIACYGHKTLLAIDRIGTFLFKYPISKPDGLDMDSESNIYVCSSDDHSIHQVTTRGENIRILFEGEMCFPRDVCFNATCDQFAIVDGTSGKELKIYRFD